VGRINSLSGVGLPVDVTVPGERSNGVVAAPLLIAADTLSVSSRPLQAAASSLPGANVLTQAPPKFNKPDEYKKYVSQFRGYLESAQKRLAEAQQVRTTEEGRLSAADEALGKPLRVAQATLVSTHRLYQEPIDRINGELTGANEALQDAIYPGRRRASRLDEEASQLGRAIVRTESAIVSVRGQMDLLDIDLNSALNRRSAAYEAQSAAKARVDQLYRQSPTSDGLASQRSRASAAADRLREVESRYARAKAAVAQQKDVTGQIDALSKARDNWGTVTVALGSAKGVLDGAKTDVTRAQMALDRALALPESDASRTKAVADARAGLVDANTKHGAAQKRVQDLERELGGIGEVSAIKNKIESLRTQLAQFGDTEVELTKATAARQSVAGHHDDAKQGLDKMVAIADELAAQRRKLANADDAIRQMDGTIGIRAAEREQKSNELVKLQAQRNSQVSRREQITGQANKARRQQNPADHPEVVTSQRRVVTLQDELKQAQATYNKQIAEPTTKVASEQSLYNQKINPFREKVNIAKTRVASATETVAQVSDALQGVKDTVSGPTKLWWRVRFQFDINKF